MNTSFLKGKNILVIGASRGLGATIAEKIWQNGANVILISRDKERLKKVIAGLGKAESQSAYMLSKDLADPDSAEQIVEFAQQHFDQLDVLINNAAVQGPIGPLWENDWDLWERTLHINLIAPIKLSRLCTQWMLLRGKGKIILLSGGGATGSRPNFTSYAIAKTGLVRFCEILAEELMPHNIQVYCVAPGVMATSLLNEVVAAGPASAGQKEYDSAMNIRKSGGVPPEKAAELITFLASDLSNGFTGKLISAVWDPWEKFPEHLDELKNSDVYTLRRVVPKDRGMDWGDV